MPFYALLIWIMQSLARHVHKAKQGATDCSVLPAGFWLYMGARIILIRVSIRGRETKGSLLDYDLMLNTAIENLHTEGAIVHLLILSVSAVNSPMLCGPALMERRRP